MLVNNNAVSWTIFFIAIVFIFIAKYQEKTHVISLIYAAILGLFGLIQSVSVPLLLIAFVGNFIISSVLFKILKHFEKSVVIYILITILGCLVLWYVADLPMPLYCLKS